MHIKYVHTVLGWRFVWCYPLISPLGISAVTPLAHYLEPVP